MKLISKMTDNVLIIEIEGELMGGAETEDFKNIIYKTIEEDVVNVVVDLAKATWMNSSGLGMLITGLSTVRSSGGELCLVNISERIKRPLEITKLDSVFCIYDSVDEAISNF
jgi:anti-sigma B factor antagonist